MGREIYEIIALLVGLATITLVLNKNANTTAVISTSGNTLNNIFRTLTLQASNGSSNFSSLSGGNGLIQ